MLKPFSTKSVLECFSHLLHNLAWKFAFEQPGLVEDVFAHGWGLELDGFQDSIQSKPFCDSMKSRILHKEVRPTAQQNVY